MAYETWWSVHLYTYLALFLSFSHQIDTGASFVGHPVARVWWTALWLGTLAVVVAARIGLPVWRSLRHRVRVVGATPEGPGVVSIVLRGRSLDRLPSPAASSSSGASSAAGSGGRRTRTRSRRRPTGDLLRITVKDLGDHSAGLARLQPGTRVAIEGPYGTFTADTAERDRLLLVGAGVGTAPVLALLQELPPEADVTVLLRASTPADLVLRDEVADEVRRRGGRLVELVGSRDQVRLDADALRELVPDVRRREVYLCGPDALSRRLAAELERAGVPEAPHPLRVLHLLSRSHHAPIPHRPRRHRRRHGRRPGLPPARPDGPDRDRHAALATTTVDARPRRGGTARLGLVRRLDDRLRHRDRRRRRHPVRQRPGAGHRQGRQDRRDRGAAAAGQRPALRADLLLGRAGPAAGGADAKQSADVDAVSGATFTSASYTQSLQSALDKLGFKAPDGSVATLAVPAGGGH